MATFGGDTMSVIITAAYQGETFDVEIFHDGHIEFPDRDLRHEQAMAEFTDSESAVIQFRDFWKKSPIHVIAASLWVVDDPFVVFMADCAEHVLPILKKDYPDLSGPKRALDIARKIAFGGLDEKKKALLLQELSVLSFAVDNMARQWVTHKRASSTALWAVAEVADVKQSVWSIYDPVNSEESEMCVYAAENAEKAAVKNASFANQKRAGDRERAWQVRRFVDIMEALGKGKPWPPFKRTR